MAIKLLVEYSSLHLTATRQKLASLSLSSEPSALLQFVDLTSSQSYVSLDADLFLDAETKNLYFSSQYDSPQVQVISMSEDSAFDFGKVLGDSLAFDDSQLVKSINKSVDESISLTEDVVIVKIYFRDFADNFSFADTQSLLSGLGKQDVTTITESLVLNSSLSKSDTLTMSEESVIATDINKDDTVAISESFDRVVSYIRAFTDAVTLDDLASAQDPLQTDNVLNKDNFTTVTDELAYSIAFPKSDSISFTDDPEISFTTSRTDSLTLSESLALNLQSIASDSTSLSDAEVISFAKSLSDSLSITESINISLITGAQGLVLNDARLNTNVLN